MWSNDSMREAETEGWNQNMNPWSNNGRQMGTNRNPPPQASMNQGYSTSTAMRQPSRSWDLHTQQQFHPGMTARWNSNWSANGTPPAASLNSPVKVPSEIWGHAQQAQWNATMINGEPKRLPAPMHRSMTGPPQGWSQKVDQQTPWDMGISPEQMPNHDWNGTQKWNNQTYPWHHNEGSPEWANGTSHHPPTEMPWNGGVPNEEDMSPPAGWPAPKVETHSEVGLPAADMVWQDPNPKMKQRKIARDTGTAIWGDPENQKLMTVCHWKDSEANGFHGNVTSGADWTLGDQMPTQQSNGWEEPMHNKIWDISAAWVDAHNDSMPDMIVPQISHALGTSTLLETLQGVTASNPHLANQISEQFQGAVNRSWISQNVYTAQITPKFAHLHQLIKRMYKKENEMLQLRQHPASSTTNSHKERILAQIQQTKNGLAEMQRVICGIPPPPTSTATTPSDGQSRLQQWKKNGNAMASNGRNTAASSLPSDSGLSSMGNDAMMSSLINAAHNLSIGADNSSWKNGSLEWSPPAARDDRRKSSEESRVSATSQLNADVQEFIPGKQWIYHNPNKIAEDPNATPGSCKPDPRLTSAALRLQMDGQVKDASHSPVSINTNQNGWNMRMMGGKQVDSPMVSPNVEHGAVKNNRFFLSNCWVLFELNNNTNEYQFQQICQHAGNMLNFCMIGNNIACVKFNNNDAYHIVRRIQNEFGIGLEQFRVVPDEEFNKKMIQHTRNVAPTEYDSAPPMMGHQAQAWNFAQPLYHNDPPCQY